MRSASDGDAAGYLLSARAVRERSRLLFDRCRNRLSDHFIVDEGALDTAAAFVIDVTRETYPDLNVPYHSRWRHFEMGGVDRWAGFAARFLPPSDPAERARAGVELAIASVLLDAGAGSDWRYREAATEQVWARSEGLAAASFAWVTSGAFSTDPDRAPWRVEPERLAAVTPEAFAAAFQVSSDNPLVGIDGRVRLLHGLAAVMTARPDCFAPGGRPPRLGHLYDRLAAEAGPARRLPAEAILSAVLRNLGGVWPGRLALGGVDLGDTWRHPALAGDACDGLVPFHKLSQWLAYSLVEPLEEAGITVEGLDGLTGLPEYRNGGLFVDAGVLLPRHEAVTDRPHRPDSEIVVEWRAATVILLDEVAARVRAALSLDRIAFPLAKVLQGGTWSAGRRLAASRRPPGGEPPIRIDSDGTVF